MRREEYVRGGTRAALRADALLAQLGLTGRESSSADRISLGQSKRVAIARAVAAGARVVFLDEPLAGLDRAGIDLVLELLKVLIRDWNLTLVIIEHVFNQRYLEELVTWEWLLERGTLVVSQKAASVFRETKPSGPRRPAWFPMLAEECSEVVDEPLPQGGWLTRVRRPGPIAASPEPVLEVRGLVVNRGPRTVVGLDEQGKQAGFDLTLYEGEIAILQAPNGWGKSTLCEAASRAHFLFGRCPSPGGRHCQVSALGAFSERPKVALGRATVLQVIQC